MTVRHLLPFATVALGCASYAVDPVPLPSTEARIRAKASEDLQCPADALQLTMQGGLWLASGCDRHQRYALACGDEVVAHGRPAGDPFARGLALLARVNDGDLPPPAKRICGYETLRAAASRPAPEACRMTHVLCEVDEQGHPRDCGIINADPELAGAMLEFAYSARFHPALRDGVPVRSLHAFTLTDGPGGGHCLRRESYLRRRR